MSRKAKRRTVTVRQRIPECGGRSMLVGTRRGTVRFYGNGPLVKPSTAQWFYEAARLAGTPIGEVMDQIADANKLPPCCYPPPIERHDDDAPVPLTP